MTAHDLIFDLSARGIVLEIADENLLFDAPVGVLTDTDRAQLKRHKREIMALLTGARPVDGTQSTLHGEPENTGEPTQGTLCADGLLRRDGFIVPTRATMPDSFCRLCL